MHLIELKNVTYTYPLVDEPTLKNISCVLEKGKFYGVIGENAGGKTTFCNLLRGLIPHFYHGELEGEILIEGEDIRTINVDMLSTKIGYIFQNPFTQISGVRKTVFEEIALGLENLGVPKKEMIERVIEIAKLLKIVIDEPTSQLDPDGTEEIFQIIHMLKEQGKTIILVEHKVDLLAEYADEIIVMGEGKILEKGDVKTVLADRSIMKKGAMIPQSALLTYSLKEEGVELPYIPVTKKECVKLLRERRMTKIEPK